MKVPCRDCKERTATCHAECGKYKEYAKFCEEVRYQRMLNTMETFPSINHQNIKNDLHKANRKVRKGGGQT